MGVLEQNRRERERERSEKKQKHFLQRINHTASMLLGGNQERERVGETEFERDCCLLTLHGFAQALTQLPAMFLKQPMSNVILMWGREEERPQYSNNKKCFPHTRTHSVTSTCGSQTTVKTSSLTVINISNTCYPFKLLLGSGRERGGR